MDMKPKLTLIDDMQIKPIVDSAFRLLREEGVVVESKLVKELLLSKVGVVENRANGRLMLPGYLVRESIESAALWDKVMYDRDSNRYPLDKTYFNPGSAAVHIIDFDVSRQARATKPRPGNTKDYIEFTIVNDHLSDIEMQSTSFVSHDVAESLHDSYRLYLALLHSPKPVITGTFGRHGFKPMVEMLTAVRGTKEELAKKPLAIFDAAPTAPLKWGDFLSENIVDCAKLGIPIEFVSMPIPGSLSPIYLYNTLIQHTAETLSGVVISQVAKKCAPLIYGGSPMTSNFRFGHCIASPEVMLINSAYAKIGQYLGLATHSYLGLSDSMFIDYQAGVDTLFGVLAAEMSGVNIASGPGMVRNESIQSIEKLVLDNETIKIVRRFKKGITERPYNKDLFSELIHGDIMRHDSTLYEYKDEILLPDPGLMSRSDTAKEDAYAGAHRKAQLILMDHEPRMTSTDIQKDLYAIMSTNARSHGMTKLPEINYTREFI